MKQLIQNFKTGALYVDELPLPALSEGMVLVENQFSLISAGTEKGTVKVAQSSLLGKAKQRPDLVAQVLQNIKKEGLRATLEKVKTKLDSLKALGYSTAGVVIASMDTNGKFKPGDRVACAGQDYASHAEVVCVPQNLTVKIPDNVSFEEASFTTLGAIALQGVRQANPLLGENICVIGLGLLGQITCQLLSANGCRVFGIDVSEKMVQLANNVSNTESYTRNNAGLMTAIETFTRGKGFDKIIITAAAPTNDPIELSVEIARKKGQIIVVGAVKMDVPRDPHFYRKELDLKISCSYGPGRYDNVYEEQGLDYPYAYVRWTEQRNMEAFLDLISLGKLNLKALITHTFNIDDAVKAYDLVLGKVQEPFIGILLKYPANENKKQSIIQAKALQNNHPIKASFIGAGSFAQSYLIPNLKELPVSLDAVVTNNGINAKNVSTKFGFARASTNATGILSDSTSNTVFIASRHDSHAKYVLQSLEAGKHVFVEKPLCLTYEELEIITEKIKQYPNQILMVGFNRRFAPVSVELNKIFSKITEPKVVNIRVNAGFIPLSHWTQQKDIGGGRILGEICHFIDLMQYFTNATPIKVYAECINSKSSEVKNDDNIAIVISFSDGSIGNLIYVANGDKSLPKERVEIFAGGMVGIINDFKDGQIFKGNKSSSIKLPGKGHKQEVDAFINAIKQGLESPITFQSIYATTLTTIKVHDALHTGLPQNI
ncbi:MAG: bi-domain-containing oxidoreductase [Bacteroidetes bacterium]|nr:bi-domain-containing oxidoreductase [Bacteroidota bacterium]